MRFAGADAEHDDAEEIAEIVPAAAVGHGVDRDLGREQRHGPRDREDEAVPQAEEEAGRGWRDGVGACVAAQAASARAVAASERYWAAPDEVERGGVSGDGEAGEDRRRRSASCRR